MTIVREGSEPSPTYHSYYYLYDGLGSVSEILDSTGDVIEKYSYDIFGKVTIRNTQGAILTTSSIGNRYYFTGRELDEETGLYYYRQRYYNPELGKFITPDPIGYKSGLNLYTYCVNNPVNWIDPKGLCDENAQKTNEENPAVPQQPQPPDEEKINPTTDTPSAPEGKRWWPKVAENMWEYGNYGGPGRTDPTNQQEPIDGMDEYFRQHDKAWAEGNADEGDKKLYEDLKGLPLNPKKWEPPALNTMDALKYRLKSVAYFGIRTIYLEIKKEINLNE